MVRAAAKTTSRIATHMGIAFALTWLMTGSAALGGLAAIIEPVINVALLPLHERAWHALRRLALASAAHAARARMLALALEKLSQTGLHIAVAFGVMFWASGSLAFGGLAALIEPVLNVIVLPFHDRLWDRFGKSGRKETEQHNHIENERNGAYPGQTLVA
ncbi:DUF2061 domain-containing protein [Massilia atriviolacea]|uniref:DUF2061 domain-containing protein n=1 Tax=Massilia atriviolacea TaxID=2495579 RepID=A0A430HFV3_9BURK|nr:DUF2061 domain-containing protein [Massilia atriviolacea]RSZ56454.1 DUF2061 domain-containing protein [Massilia atriviolacea]